VGAFGPHNPRCPLPPRNRGGLRPTSVQKLEFKNKKQNNKNKKNEKEKIKMEYE